MFLYSLKLSLNETAEYHQFTKLIGIEFQIFSTILVADEVPAIKNRFTRAFGELC